MKPVYAFSSTSFLLLSLLSQGAWSHQTVTEVSNLVQITNASPALSQNYAYDVWIQTDALDSQGDTAPAYCNASLLDARTLVTAAHCFQYAVQLGSRALSVTMGAYKYVTRPNGTQARIGYASQPEQKFQAQFVFLPSLQQRLSSDPSSAGSVSIGPDEDIALAVLPQPLALPSGFQFVKVLPLSAFSEVQNSISSYLPQVLAVNPIAQVSTSDTKRIAQLDSISWSSGYFESHSTSQLEEGDSGAPLLVTYQGQQMLAGVVKGHGSRLWMSWDAFAPAGENLCTLGASAGRTLPGC